MRFVVFLVRYQNVGTKKQCSHTQLPRLSFDLLLQVFSTLLLFLHTALDKTWAEHRRYQFETFNWFMIWVFFLFAAARIDVVLDTRSLSWVSEFRAKLILSFYESYETYMREKANEAWANIILLMHVPASLTLYHRIMQNLGLESCTFVS